MDQADSDSEIGIDGYSIGKWLSNKELIEKGFERQRIGIPDVYHMDGIAFLAKTKTGEKGNKYMLIDCHPFSLDVGERYTLEEMEENGIMMEFPTTCILSGCQGTERYQAKLVDSRGGKEIYEITQKYWIHDIVYPLGMSPPTPSSVSV